jgi:hypothetical protein
MLPVMLCIRTRRIVITIGSGEDSVVVIVPKLEHWPGESPRPSGQCLSDLAHASSDIVDAYEHRRVRTSGRRRLSRLTWANYFQRRSRKSLWIYFLILALLIVLSIAVFIRGSRPLGWPTYLLPLQTFRRRGPYRDSRTPPVTVTGAPSVSNGVRPASTGWFSRFCTCK